MTSKQENVRFFFRGNFLNFNVTTGMASYADGHVVRRRPNIGAVSIQAGQPNPSISPSAYMCPRGTHGYADGHPRRTPGRRRSCK
jgi:hypothetical protein